MRLGEPDASGRRRPEPVPGSEFVLEADTVVKAIGQRPRRELAEWIAELELARTERSRRSATGRPANPRIFAGGDVINGGTSVGRSGARGEARCARDRRVPRDETA